jgi:deazaflavin-dependent oxidoreductase (nitroreductase family)
MAAARPNPVLRRLFRAPIYLYRWHCGRLLGHRFLLLAHVGRRTGRRRETVLEVLEYRPEGPEAVVMSAFGRRAQWLRNIEATPGPEVTMGSQHFVAAYRLLDEGEAATALAGYERRNRYAAPIIRRVLSRLVGWRYDGSPDARLRLVRELPLVAFRPAADRHGGGPANCKSLP